MSKLTLAIVQGFQILGENCFCVFCTNLWPARAAQLYRLKARMFAQNLLLFVPPAEEAEWGKAKVFIYGNIETLHTG